MHFATRYHRCGFPQIERGNRRTGPVRPPENATTDGEMQRYWLGDGLVVTLGGRRP